VGSGVAGNVALYVCFSGFSRLGLVNKATDVCSRIGEFCSVTY
jgi:hypothetical protein